MGWADPGSRVVGFLSPFWKEMGGDEVARALRERKLKQFLRIQAKLSWTTVADIIIKPTNAVTIDF